MNYLPDFPVEFIVTVLGFGIGFYLGNSGKNFDHEVQQTEWFGRLGRFRKWLVKQALNTTHHFQYGLLLMYIAKTKLTGDLQTFVYSLGFGMLVTDIKDVPARFRKFFRGWHE